MSRNLPSLPSQEVTEWCERCRSFHLLCQMVKDMYNRLTTIPNRPLLYDVYQYMWDAKETTLLLDSYISWLGIYTMYTVEPPNKGHVGTRSFVLYREVSFILRLK